ncbi:hypothetical protein ACWDV4_23875 [Micromonospora sp. NPDC003197]
MLLYAWALCGLCTLYIAFSNFSVHYLEWRAGPRGCRLDRTVDHVSMKLRRSYSDRVSFLMFGMLMLSGAVAAAYKAATESRGWSGWLFYGVLGLLCLAIAYPRVRRAILPFRVDVDSQGWSIRTPKLNRHLRWDEITAVVLVESPSVPRQRVALGPRLLLVPAAGVSLGVPLTEESPVDGQAAVELFRLNEVDWDGPRLVRQLTVLAGERFHNLGSHLTWPTGAIPLRRFPDEPDRTRLKRWLDRQEYLLFVGWYLLVLVPSLLLVGVAAQRHELFGVGVLIAGAGAVITITWKIWRIFGDRRGLAEREAALDGPHLVVGNGSPHYQIGLQYGTVNVLSPGSRRGYGKAWLLTHPGPKGRAIADLLLSDPRTGRLRDRETLRTLATVLGASSHESDRAAGQQVEELAAQAAQTPLPAPATEALPSSTIGSDELPASAAVPDLWQAVEGMGRAVAFLAVVAAVEIAGGRFGESAALVGTVSRLFAVCLFGVWIAYAFYRTVGFLSALLAIAVRARR